MISLAAPAVVCLVGLLLYALTTGKLSEIGKIAFAVGLFFVVQALGGEHVRFR